MSTDQTARAWVEVDGSALLRNLETIRETVRAHVGEGVRLIPMVKADAYGLGVSQAVTVLRSAGTWGYGVATVAEGQELRGLGVTEPILVVSPVPPGGARGIAESSLIPLVSSIGELEELRRASRDLGRDVKFHVEVDTGMGRSGFDWRESTEWLPAIHDWHGDGLVWSGIATHFHSADEDAPSVRAQWERFQGVLRDIGPRAGDFLIHACNSAGALRRPEYAARGVRPGIFLYGGKAGEDLPAPEPVVAIRARIGLIRTVPADTTVGYGATYRTTEPRRLATVCIGYGDGVPRALGNRGDMAFKGRRVRIVGRISMDVTVVDITEVEGAEVGDVVTFLGTDGDAAISLDEIAASAGTVDYEILTGLSARMPRVWIA